MGNQGGGHVAPDPVAAEIATIQAMNTYGVGRVFLLAGWTGIATQVLAQAEDISSAERIADLADDHIA